MAGPPQRSSRPCALHQFCRHACQTQQPPPPPASDGEHCTRSKSTAHGTLRDAHHKAFATCSQYSFDVVVALHHSYQTSLFSASACTWLMPCLESASFTTLSNQLVLASTKLRTPACTHAAGSTAAGVGVHMGWIAWEHKQECCCHSDCTCQAEEDQLRQQTYRGRQTSSTPAPARIASSLLARA